MRQIKFRAWDKETKTMNTNGSIGAGSSADIININFEGRISLQNAYGLDMGARNPTFDEPSDRFILMQFTGLQDKNGKDIYEGDIYRAYNNEDEPADCVVEYNEYCASFDGIVYPIHEAETLYSHWQSGIVVVGNIHENPELLQS